MNFVCHVQMSKYMYKKPRHLFIQKLYYSLFQTCNKIRLNKITKSVKSINLKTN